MKKLAFLIPGCCLALGFAAEGTWQRFYPDDPMWQEPRITIRKPAVVKRSEISDFLENSSAREPHGEIAPAANSNTVGGVPDSAWFENRVGTGKMSLVELVKGPNRGDGPDMSSAWEITDPKNEGVTAGFKIKDGRGDKYFVKLDPLKYPQLTTSAEVISTKFFHAFGYNVPENYLAYVRRDQLRLGEEALKEGFTEQDLDEMLERAPQRPDRTYQVLASLMIDGDPIGQFKFWGTRPDDPNDVVPHQNRRELRGLRLFCAWLNHIDIDAINTLDVFVGKEDKGHVKHYLIDFGTTLGSGAFEPQRPRVGHEYSHEWGKIVKSILTLGVWEREWQTIEYPDYPSVGNFEAQHFHPEKWRPDYLNPAFERMRPGDAFWAAATISRFTDEMVRELVKVGRLTDPEAERYLLTTLLDRRDKILSYYLSRMNPIDRFEVRPRAGGSHLTFANLATETGVGHADSYEYTWYSYENGSDSLKRLRGPQSVALETVPIPADSRDGFLAVEFRTMSRDKQDWAKPVVVYLRRDRSRYRVIGIEREEVDGQQDLERRRQLAEKRHDWEAE